MISYAILIDGGFVRKKLGTTASPVDATRIARLIEWIGQHAQLSSHRLHRVYFYDARPLDGIEACPLQGQAVNFSNSPLNTNNRRLHAGLTRVPFVSLRMGELSFGGWRVNPRLLNSAANSLTVTAADLRPEVRQKGVDMRIGLDIAALTLKAHVKIIVLVTGDSDFVPAMKFARREGAQLLLFTLGHGVFNSMFEHADQVIESKPPAAAVANPAQPALAPARTPPGSSA